MKETFIIRTEWYDAISDLDAECKAIILDNFFYYHIGEETKINLNNPMVKLVWKLIEPNMKRNADAYDKRRETSKENGKKGGRPPKEENNLNKPKKPNETLSVSDSVSVSDTESVSDINILDSETLYPVSKLKEFYLNDEDLIKAIIKNKDNKLKDKAQLIIRLEEFNIFCLETGKNSRLWNDYTTHFRNWNKKQKEIQVKSDRRPTDNLVF